MQLEYIHFTNVGGRLELARVEDMSGLPPLQVDLDVLTLMGLIR